MTEEKVILVDAENTELGVMDKLEVHEKGILHRAFSIFIFNTQGQLLLQRRAMDKYHSGGLWTNTCCSHPRPNEDTKDAANRRLMEEMGMQCTLDFAFSFVYKASVANHLTEHEFDLVYTGLSNAQPHINTSEVMDYQYLDMKTLMLALQQYPDRYTVWLKDCFPQIQQVYQQMFKKGLFGEMVEIK